MFSPFVHSVKRWISNSYIHRWKGLKYVKYAEKLKFAAPEGFFWRMLDSLTVQGQMRDSRKAITKKKKNKKKRNRGSSKK